MKRNGKYEFLLLKFSLDLLQVWKKIGIERRRKKNKRQRRRERVERREEQKEGGGERKMRIWLGLPKRGERECGLGFIKDGWREKIEGVGE